MTMQRRDNQGGRLLMRTPARPRLPDGDCVFISGARIAARANAPRHRCRHGATGIRSSTHPFAYCLPGFETGKESLSKIRHQLRIDAREGARAASVHQGCIPGGPHRLRRSSNAHKSIWTQAKPPASSVTHGKATRDYSLWPQHGRKLSCTTAAGMCGLRSQ